jgi:hypothetical protein
MQSLGTWRVTSVKWCLTPLTNPNNHLHGPYETRERATKEALLLLSHEAKRSAALALRRPATLVPTPCDGSCTAHLQAPPPAPDSPLSLADSSVRELARAPLPAAIYKLTEGKLRYFATQLGIELPPTANTRAAIISIITKEIDL